MTTEGSSPLFGVNLPWFDGAYGHDIAPNERLDGWPVGFDAMRAYRPMIEASEIGFSAVRVWLCENGEGIQTEGGLPARPHERLVEGVKVLQECARLLGIRIYWSLLDGNSWGREGDTLTQAILGDRTACERFATHVAAPLVRVMDPAVTFAVEVVNEPEAMSPDCVGAGLTAIPWTTLAGSIRRIGDAIRTERPGTIVTSGTLHQYLPQFLRADPRVDAIDLHAYHLEGGLPPREHLAKYTSDARLLDGSIPLIAGECGIPDDAPAEALAALTHFVFNARQYRYDAAFLWRLEKVLVDTKSPRAVTALGRDVRAVLGR